MSTSAKVSPELIKSLKTLSEAFSNVDPAPIQKAVVTIIKAAKTISKSVPPTPHLRYGIWILDYLNSKNARQRYRAFVRGYLVQPEVIKYCQESKIESWQLTALYRSWQRPSWLIYLQKVCGYR